MQDYLNQIYAHAHIPTPDAADLLFEVQDLLRYEPYAQKVFIQLKRESCPYRREGLLECFRRELKDSGLLIEGNLYMMDNNDCCMLVWREAEREIKQAIRVCEKDKEDNLEQQEDVNLQQHKQQQEQLVSRATTQPATRETIYQQCEQLQTNNKDNDTAKRSTISSVVQQVKDTVKHTVKEIVKDITPQQPVNINIQQLTIPIHIYNAPIGQYGDTVISELDNLIQDNHGKMNF